MSAPATLDLALANARVSVCFDAPVASERVLRGKRPEEAVKLIGIIHNLCAEAHRACARAACGLEVPAEAGRAAMIEILREHLVILCRTAPPLLGLEPVALPIAFSRLGAAFAPGEEPMRESLSRAVFGTSSGAPFSLADVERSSLLAPFFALLALRERAMGLEARDVSLPSDPTFFERICRDAAFTPPQDCGPVRERLLGRLYEAHKLMAAFNTPDERDYLPRQTQPGVARMNAARGTLHHRVEMEEGLIARYAIETPTAAMLDEGGPLRAFLEAIARAPQADEAMIRLGLCAFDPCVPYSVTLTQDLDRRLADA